MLKPNPLQCFERRLVELGGPQAKIRRAVDELADHYEDLQRAAREEGFSSADIEARAEEKLGEPLRLAEHTVLGWRQSSWWGRHPIIGFCVLPPLCFGPAWILFVLLCGSLFWIIEQIFGPSAGDWLKAFLVQADNTGTWLPIFEAMLNATVIGLFTLLFCWLARRTAAGSKWALLACATSAVHGLFFHINLSAHHLALRYWWKPNWVVAMTVLLVAGGVLLRQWRAKRRPVATLALPILLIGLFGGCASRPEKVVQQRGWIGGEYKLARKDNLATRISASPAVAGGLPQALATKQKAAILVTALDPTAPAQVAGLRKGDLVLEVNHQPVIRLRDFWKILDGCAPGDRVSVKAYRDGQTLDFEIPVGKEAFRHGGTFRIVFPSVVHGWDLWPNPGFSLVFIGYQPNPGLRPQHDKSDDLFNEDWKTFAGIFELSSGKRILEQKN